MKRFSEQLKKQSTTIKLRGDERADLRDRLVTYMEYHPLPPEMRATMPAKKAPTLLSEPFTVIEVNWSLVRGFVGSLAVIALVVVPMMAERSAPGDVLYPVKVEFNEEFRSTLAFSPEKKIEWETTRLERRIAEARLLASEGKLDTEVEAEVAAAVKEQSQKTKNEIAKLRTTDEAEAAFAEIALASMLEVQSELFEQTLAASDGERNDTEVHATGAGVTEVLSSEITTTITDASQKVTTDQLFAKIEEETTRAEELYASIAEFATTEEDAAIARRLADVKRKVQSAHTMLHPVTEVVDEAGEPIVVTAEIASTSEEFNDPAMPASSTTISEAVLTETTTDSDVPDESSDLQQDTVLPAEVEVLDAAHADAKVLLHGALKDLRKLISFMSDIDIREHVDIETIVPVVLTDDERIAAITTSVGRVEASYAAFTRDTTEVMLTEKQQLSIDRFQLRVTQTKSALRDGKLTEAETAIKDASAILHDLEQVVPAAAVATPPSNEVIEVADVPDTESSSSSDVVVE